MVDFGWSLPPGVTTSMIPGNRPEDEAWDHYWQDEEERHIRVYEEVFGHEPSKDEVKDGLESLYGDTREEFTKAIDKDFEDWRDEPEMQV